MRNAQFFTKQSAIPLPIRIKTIINLWESPSWSFVFALVIYFLLALFHGSPWKASQYSFFNYLADAFIHGQLNLRILPPVNTDLVIFNNSYYLYWPPFPAILLAPFIAIFGLSFSDILFTVFVGAVNVMAAASILRAANKHGVIHLDQTKSALLVIFFSVGTVQLILASLGRVWFTSMEIGFLCVAIAYWAVLNLDGWKAFLIAGIAIAGASTTRNHLFLAGIWPAWYLLNKYWSQGYRKIFQLSIYGLIPIFVAASLIFIYNYSRFGNPLDVGLNYHNMSPFFKADFEQYGTFNIHYIPTNIYFDYIYYPFPPRSEFFMGGSLFLLSPLFFAALLGFWKNRSMVSTWMLLITIITLNIPILLLMGTGWVTFGPRYTFDFTLPLIILTALGIQEWSRRTIGILVNISFIHYLGGALMLSKYI